MMTRHPEIQRRAQAEIDKVVGSSRLPVWNDRDDLPMIDRILKESYRINPPVPLGVPHSSIKSDTYQGMDIPEGSVILPNIWRMMRDEQYFPNPEVFDPDRYASNKASAFKDDDIQDDGHADDSAADPKEMVFGFGRRICPGRFFADASLWLAIANVLCVFNVLRPLDPVTGEEFVPEAAFKSGLSSVPKPFACRVVPRSDKHAELVRGGLARHM